MLLLWGLAAVVDSCWYGMLTDDVGGLQLLLLWVEGQIIWVLTEAGGEKRRKVCDLQGL